MFRCLNCGGSRFDNQGFLQCVRCGKAGGLRAERCHIAEETSTVLFANSDELAAFGVTIPESSVLKKDAVGTAMAATSLALQVAETIQPGGIRRLILYLYYHLRIPRDEILRLRLTEPEEVDSVLARQDDLADRLFPIKGRIFIDASGTWICELARPVDVSGVDKRVFFFRFTLVKPDPRRNGIVGEQRTLELRTSLTSFHNVDGREGDYAPWLELVVQGFLASGKIENVIEAYQIERG